MNNSKTINKKTSRLAVIWCGSGNTVLGWMERKRKIKQRNRFASAFRASPVL